MRFKDYSFGIFLIFVGVLFLLLNLDILTFEWLLLALSIGILVGYFLKRHISYLILGLILLGISLMSIINQYVFIEIDVKSFLFLLIFGIACLVLYGRQRNRALLTIGAMLIALGTNNLIEELITTDVRWTLYLLFGIAFYIIYIIGYRESDVEWPKHLGTVMIIVSLIFLLSSQTMLQFGFWQIIFYLLPILLIGIGIKIIYNIKKLKE